MKRLVALFLLGVATPAAQPVALSAESRHQPSPVVDILVNGVSQRRYPHQGRWYIEALKGREYAIRLHNPYGVRVAVALSVDGLNTIDARHTAAADARKWVIDPYQTITISGWQISRTQARRFEFTTEARSYAQALGAAGNLGIISAVFYRERVPSEAGLAYRVPKAAPAPAPQARASQESAPASADAKLSEHDYAATGMGEATTHRVTQVHLDLETSPVHTMNIRYEFRAQLAKLGILPDATADRLRQREHANGFEPGFSPVPPGLR